MFDFIQSAVQPIIVETLVVIASGAVLWFARFLPETWRLYIEANHRQALHSALNTAVGLVLDGIQKNPAVAVPDAAITQGLSYVYGSVPKAIRRLGPSREQLEQMLRAKVQLRLDEIVGRTQLSEALNYIGITSAR